ncbi:MAG: hypothetical protein JO322_10365 [Candidatus Eremiobacteraeota bacterium]|nr:hypothetical protein [Candidatus Eremiobacteraeota bacterium]
MATADGAIPLLVGVTGHRDVAEPHVDAARDLVTQRLQQLARDYPHTPIVVLSPLAEGADRIVAEAALALHLELVVPLPVSLEQYRRDFTAPESLEAFDALLAQAKASFVVPTPSGPVGEDERYTELGAFIARTSDLLIALWDGMPSRGAGGTADVVDARIANTEPIDWIIVSRNGSANVEQHISHSHHMPEPSTWSRVDEFNRDAARDFPSQPRPSLFAIADELAMRFHAEQNRALDCTFACIAAAVFAIEGYELDVSLGPGTGMPSIVFLIANVISFAAAFFVVAYARSKRFESKSQDYRALSEALRIQRFWNALDLGGDLGALYERKHEVELEWVRKALRSSSRYDVWRGERRGRTVQHWVERARDACEAWVEDQERFFNRAKKRDEAKVQRAHRASGLLILAVSILTLALIVNEIAPAPVHDVREIILFLISVFAAVSALIHGYADKSAWAYHAREYARMSELYRSAGKELAAMLKPESQEPEAARALFRSLAREALSENADWLLAHRERPIEMPDT